MLILVFEGFQIEIHAELKNEHFVQGHHISQFITLKVFVIQTNCLQLYNSPLLVFLKMYLKPEVNREAYQRHLFHIISVILKGVA